MPATRTPYVCLMCARPARVRRCGHCGGTCYVEPRPARLNPGFLRPGILGAELVNVERAIRRVEF